ncbi:hypothetical protein H4582DRAFT_497925 [Lactarius indigo]|nr:hypothetical protein H4582DRAFT_497925 [Lactarius indigo]
MSEARVFVLITMTLVDPTAVSHLVIWPWPGESQRHGVYLELGLRHRWIVCYSADILCLLLDSCLRRRPTGLWFLDFTLVRVHRSSTLQVRLASLEPFTEPRNHVD